MKLEGTKKIPEKPKTLPKDVREKIIKILDEDPGIAEVLKIGVENEKKEAGVIAGRKQAAYRELTLKGLSESEIEDESLFQITVFNAVTAVVYGQEIQDIRKTQARTAKKQQQAAELSCPLESRTQIASVTKKEKTPENSEFVFVCDDELLAKKMEQIEKNCNKFSTNLRQTSGEVGPEFRKITSWGAWERKKSDLSNKVEKLADRLKQPKTEENIFVDSVRTIPVKRKEKPEAWNRFQFSTIQDFAKIFPELESSKSLQAGIQNLQETRTEFARLVSIFTPKNRDEDQKKFVKEGDLSDVFDSLVSIWIAIEEVYLLLDREIRNAALMARIKQVFENLPNSLTQANGRKNPGFKKRILEIRKGGFDITQVNEFISDFLQGAVGSRYRVLQRLKQNNNEAAQKKNPELKKMVMNDFLFLCMLVVEKSNANLKQLETNQSSKLV